MKSKAPIVSVRISPEALAVVALHAQKHQHEPVCGFLLGEMKENDMLQVTEAVAVAHETITFPLLDTALGLLLGSSVKAESIVGWYVAPRLLKDETPDPVSLRVAAQLATQSQESILVVVQNEKLVECIENSSDSASSGFVKVFGRDFGDQWLDEIKNPNTGDSKAVFRLISEATASGIEVVDLADHFDAPSTTTWYPNAELANLAKQLG